MTRTDTERLEWLESLSEILTWEGYGPNKSWGGQFESMTGEDAISRFGMWGFLNNYQTHFMGNGNKFLGETRPNYNQEEMRTAIDAAMDAESP